MAKIPKLIICIYRHESLQGKEREKEQKNNKIGGNREKEFFKANASVYNVGAKIHCG